MAIASAGIVYTLINALWQLKHPSILLLRHDGTSVCNRMTPGLLHAEPTAVDL
jgi:hypothetical protein